MIVHWATFLPALALLLIPITLFHGPKVRYRGISHDWRNIWPQAFGLGLHAIDFCRAILGAWLLLDSLNKGHATGFMRYGMPITFAAVLLTAVISQMTFRAKLDTMHAPFAFIAGLVFGFYPSEIAAYTLLLAVVTALGTKMPAVFFPVLAVALPAVGYVFARSLLLNLIVGSVVTLLPWLWSLLFAKEMIVSYRARRASDDSASGPSRRE